ncbi:PREDICTED: uncharacterized protein LOC108568993 [Nicrophorus vespilloides]|uniref:Uncharacterized protein LOC108568993 n=1 Tax=Nicrophorus vespilloides TaxID=110193 RepID=A0ABM1NG97_NICVS|nr:PREDICTED: uncharacterized protein LOC108568993 [Nicrophorus vespilloides]
MHNNYMEQFHNLGGKTLGEHQRNLRKYCVNVSGLPKAEIDALLEAINPKNHQEDIFYTKLLLQFHKNEKILHVFTNCNKVLNRIIVKDKKFIGFIASIGATAFVDELCPKISYVDRSIVINKLGLFLENGDDFFEAVKEKYGLAAAIRLLPTCKEELIKQHIADYNIDFSDRELIRLHKKYPNFLKYYFEVDEYKQLNSKVMLVKYLVNNNMDTFMTLTSDFSYHSLGRKGFLKLLRHDKKFVIEHPSNFNKYISCIYRHLDETDYRQFMKNLFPKNIEELYWMDGIFRCFKLLPIDKRCRQFCDIYKEIYSVEYTTFDSNLMEMISTEDRLKFDLEENWEFYPLKEAFEQIKYRIDLAHEINARSTLLYTLVRACKINKDDDALLEVLKYFCSKHKNDTIDVRKNFLRSLTSNINLLKLSDEHWKYINEILLIFEVNGDSYFDNATFLKSQILIKANKGENCDKELVKLLKEIGVNGDWRLLRNYPAEERKCLLRYPSLWHKTNFMQEGSASIKFLETISDFNKNYPNHEISYYAYPRILDSFFDKVEKSDDQKKHAHLINIILCYISKEREEVALRERLLKDFINNSKNFVTETLYVWVLKYRPEWICVEASNILLKTKKLPKFYYEISKMHYNGVSDVFKDAAMKIIDDPNKIEMVPKLILSLSYYPNYLDLIQKYAPDSDCKIDLYSSGIKIVLSIQKTILKSLKNTFKQSENIPTILHYSNGDYLQYTLEPMYRTLYHSPQNLLEETLKMISARSVSVRKHYIYLSTVLLPMCKIEECLKECGSKEKNTSVKKFLFKCNYSCFVNNPTLELFELFKTHLALVDKKDTESTEMIFQINGIAKKYFVEYVLLLWNYSKSSMENEKFRIPSYFTKNNIVSFPDDFFCEIIEECLFHPKNNCSYTIPSFVYNYITCKPNAAQIVIEKIGKSMENVEKHVSLSLFQEICEKLLQEKDKEKAAVSSKKVLDALISSSFSNFEFEVLLKFTNHLLHNDYKTLPLFIIEQQKKYMDTYGPEICVHYSKITFNALQLIHNSMEANTNDLNYELINRLLEESSSTHVKLLVAFILPPPPKKNVLHAKHHEAIKKHLLKDSNPLLKIFLDCNTSMFC